MLLAAMAAMPLIQQVEQGLATRIANGVSGFLAPTGTGAAGKNVPAATSSSSANSAQPATLTSSVSSSLANALLKLQSDASSVGGHHHHHGAGKYKAAASTASDLQSQVGTANSSGSAAAAVTA